MRRGSRWLLVGVLAVVAACGARFSSKDRLVDALTIFVDAMRWGQYDQTSAFVPEKQRKAYLEAHDRLAELIEITDLELLRRTMGPGDFATVTLAVSWIAKSEQIVRKTVLEQRWEPKGDAWQMVRERHLRGDRLPGTPTPGSASAPASQPGAK